MNDKEIKHSIYIVILTAFICFSTYFLGGGDFTRGESLSATWMIHWLFSVYGVGMYYLWVVRKRIKREKNGQAG